MHAIIQSNKMRIGFGYDAHKLVSGRKLILGGVEVPHEKGLLGHSDADVLTHAIIDALIGAIGAGSIGDFFPNTDEKYKGANSLELLKEVYTFISEKNYLINNIDSTVVCQEPLLSPYIMGMRKKTAEILQLDVEMINIKAKTEEGMGFTGKKQGISAYAVVLVHKKI